MSSKKRKSTGQFWYICDICKSIVQVKDTALHKENSCSVNDHNLSHRHIRKSVLYSKLETCKIEDIQFLRSVPRERQNSFILISMNALQFIKVPIGDPVVISPWNGESFTPFVKLSWPSQEKNLSVYVPKQVLDVYSVNQSTNVMIEPLNGNIDIAHEITIQCETKNKIARDIDVLSKIKSQNVGNVYCVKNMFSYIYYGKQLMFKIVDITSVNENIETLSAITNKFYAVSDETNWRFKDNILEENLEPVQSMKKIGGLQQTIEELTATVSLAFQNKNILNGLYITRGVLIYGPEGTGKTSLVEVIAQICNANILKLESCQIFSKYLGEAERQLTSHFEKAKQLSPSIILIDDLDVMCPKSNSRNDQEKRIVATLSMLLDKLHSDSTHSVMVFATTSRLGAVNKSLRRPGRFGKEIEIHVPNSNQRKEILEIYLEHICHNLSCDDVKCIADLSHGFVGADLISLVSKAVLKKCNRIDDAVVSVEDFHWALAKVKPSAMREVLIDIPNVSWNDIGGQDDLKLKLRQAVEWPLKYENSFRRLGIIPPRGLLMFGPPGCSKTMIAKALASESKLNFISIKGPELFSKWVGESERAVREVFRRARQVAPSIIFFDELDAIGCERNTSGTGTNVEERVLAQLLTELDGVEPLGNVTIVGATNRPDRIDPALLRPGRFDRILYVPLPDTDTRRQILSIQFRKTPIAEDVDLEELVVETDGYSGAEIVAVCHEAALKALEEDFTSAFVVRKHFVKALNLIHPRTPQSLLEIYEKYLSKPMFATTPDSKK